MTRTPRATASLAALALLLVPLSACAAEPGTERPDGTDLTEKVEPEGGSWPEENPEEVFEKSAELPADFPAEFVVPESALVDDAGSRGPGVWFVVFKASDDASAALLWDEIVSAGGFTVGDETETGDGGRSATLSVPALEVTAVTLPADDGAVLLSYDLVSVGS
ncbi:hypothetical protein ACI1US_01622 [Leucobacter sp. BZR 635]